MNGNGAKAFEDLIEPLLRALVSRTGVPGIALAVDSSRLRAAVGAGLASSRSTSEMTPHHRLPISCVMKVLVALLVLYADDQGLLALDDDVAIHVPSLAGGEGARTGISIRHLLTHTAGYIEPQENSARWGYTWERFTAFFPQRKQAFAPGTVWSYTHTGYAILQKVVEAAFGHGIVDLLDEHIFTPLAIEPILYGAAEAQAANLMRLHVRSRTGALEPMRPPAETGFLRYSISDFALSAADIARIGRFLAGGLEDAGHLDRARGRLLGKAIELPQFCSGPEGEVMPVAFCHGVSDYGATKGVNGSYVGSTCALRFSEQAKTGFAATVNTWAPHVRDVAVQGFDRILPQRGRARAVAKPVADLAAFEGEYEGLMLGVDVTSVKRDGDTLLCHIRRKGAPELVSRIGLDPTGGLAPVGGAKDAAIAFANDPARGEPYLMVGTSACRKMAS